MKILLTGFQPFGKDNVNPTEQLAGYFGGIVLPVVRYACFENFKKQFLVMKPKAVVMLGMAGESKEIRIERVAINLDDYKIPDNHNNQPKNEPIVPGAPAAYFSTLPIQPIFNSLLTEKIPVRYSLSAGSYICNHLFFQVLHFLEENHLNIPSGFIHFPHPDMDWETMKKAVDIILSEVERRIR